MAAEIPVVAYSFESRFPLKQVLHWFPDGAVASKPLKTHAFVMWERGQAFAFDFGGLVFIDVEPRIRDATLAAFQAELPREPHPPLREDFLVEIRESVRPGHIETGFDRVVVSALTPAACEVIATVLAQSVSLDYYDEDIQAILDRMGRIAAEVARRGKIGGKTADLVRFIAGAVASQVEMISAIALLDKPDLTWEDEFVDRLHDKLRAQFEIAERHKAIETKLQTARDSMTLFLEMSQTRRTLILEATIVVLIVVEIILGLLRVL